MIPPTEAGLRSIDAAVCHTLAESHHTLLRFLTRRLGSREEAEEVLSTFYVRSLSRASDIRNLQSLRGWLRRVLETTIADHRSNPPCSSGISPPTPHARHVT